MPSTLKFGFLGLGIMGSGIVKNLINSGHSVIVWNRTQEKVCTTYFVSLIYNTQAILNEHFNLEQNKSKRFLTGPTMFEKVFSLTE